MSNLLTARQDITAFRTPDRFPDIDSSERISIYVKAMIKLRGGTAWGPPARPDRLDFLGKEGGLPGDRRDRTLLSRQTIKQKEIYEAAKGCLYFWVILGND